MNTVLRLIREHRRALLLLAVLVLSTVAALSLLAFRVYYSGTTRWMNLVWDLFLAWLPFWFAVPLAAPLGRGRGATLVLLASGFLWLLFFPNAPYLLTEFIHLPHRHALGSRDLDALAGISPRGHVPLWYDMMMVSFFAWNGVLLGLVSLHMARGAVARRLGGGWGWVMVFAVAWLSGFGISLGRFERWNSWDLFTKPGTLLPEVFGRMLNPLDHPRTTAVTLLFAAFLLLAYLTVLAMTHLWCDRCAAERGAATTS